MSRRDALPEAARMNGGGSDPLTTHQLFGHDRVAAGYASARPYLHSEMFARVRQLIGAVAPLRRALDVGCGTGLSSVALRDLASEVTAVDVSVPMLRRARRVEHVRYLACSAEALPFRPGRFDLIATCGSIDWVDRGRFLPRAAELLVSGGWLTSVDFGDTGRSGEMPGLERWHEEVLHEAYPSPPSPDPMVTSAEAERFGFGKPANHTFASQCSFTAAQYSDFLMTESNVIAAVEYGGKSAGEIRGWLESQLAPLFGTGSHAVAFGGYIQVLQKR